MRQSKRRKGSFPTVNCPNCNTDNPSNANYCSQCGATLNAPKEEPQGNREQGLAPQESPPGIGMPTPEQHPAAMEAVEYAGFWLRGAALAIDLIIVLLLYLALASLGLVTVAWVIEPIYFVYFTGTRGQTPGKMAVGVKVVKPGREAPGIGNALVREVLGKFISRLPLGLGYAWAGWDPWRQAWHDKIAGTYVIRTQSGLFQPPPK